jgi:hypothetical protein
LLEECQIQYSGYETIEMVVKKCSLPLFSCFKKKLPP